MKATRNTLILGFISACCLLAVACKHTIKNDDLLAESNYPFDVAKIIVNKCATSGCHNAQSGPNSNGIILDTWEHMFYGGNHGAIVVPYSTDYSPMLFYINVDSNLGPVATPSMPYNATSTIVNPPLSKNEYLTIKNWIANGAPDKDGHIAFEDNAATRQKIYVTQQMPSQSMVAVIDAEKQVVMRYIPLGTGQQNGLPHCIRVAPAGDYAYVCMYTGRSIKKIDCATDKVVGEASLDFRNTPAATIPEVANWNVVYVYDNGKKLLVSKTDADGALVAVDAATMTQTANFYTSNFMSYPHGIASNAAGDTLFVTAQSGNWVYRWPYGAFPRQVPLDPGSSIMTQPHEIIMSPDNSKYFVACQNTNDVRVFDAHVDTLMGIIPVGKYPQELAISTKYPYLFVSCTLDPASCNKCMGSVAIINYENLELVKKIEGVFNEPHAVAVDDRSNSFYIISRNQDPVNGLPSHHCIGGNCKSGWYEVYNMATLKSSTGKRCQLLPDPYSADTRFK